MGHDDALTRTTVPVATVLRLTDYDSNRPGGKMTGQEDREEGKRRRPKVQSNFHPPTESRDTRR